MTISAVEFGLRINAFTFGDYETVKLVTTSIGLRIPSVFMLALLGFT